MSTAIIPSRFGVEQEHFILHSDGLPPLHSEIDSLWRKLCKRGFRVRAVNAEGCVLSVESSLPTGPICISCEACTNTLEVSFPPFVSMSGFRRLYEDTWALLRSLLSQLDIELKLGGTLASNLPQVFWRPKESDPDQKRLRSILAARNQKGILQHHSFPALVAATQVSLDACHSSEIRLLPLYYSFEFLIPLFFSTSPRFARYESQCVRPQILDSNFDTNSGLVCVPKEIPCDITNYERLRAPHDHSFVALRGIDPAQQRLEFRSACSQNNVERVLQLVQFRIAVSEAVHEGKTGKWCPRKTFWKACSGEDVPEAEEALEILAPFLARRSVALSVA